MVEDKRLLVAVPPGTVSGTQIAVRPESGTESDPDVDVVLTWVLTSGLKKPSSSEEKDYTAFSKAPYVPSIAKYYYMNLSEEKELIALLWRNHYVFQRVQ